MRTVMTKLLGVLLLLFLALPACERNGGDTVGDQTEEATEQMGDAVEDAGQGVEDAGEQVTD